MATVPLFSYGTLQLPQVQRDTFHRLLEGRADRLPGYTKTMLEITDPAVLASSGATHHPIVTHTGNPSDTIEGTVFQITEEELKAADTYEVADYKRIQVQLQSGTEAWVYVAANP